MEMLFDQDMFCMRSMFLEMPVCTLRNKGTKAVTGAPFQKVRLYRPKGSILVP